MVPNSGYEYYIFPPGYHQDGPKLENFKSLEYSRNFVLNVGSSVENDIISALIIIHHFCL